MYCWVVLEVYGTQKKSVLTPVVWCIEWPEEMNIRFVTFENPEGDISVSDLELAAVLLGCMVLEDIVDTKWKHIGTLFDIMPALRGHAEVHQNIKGSWPVTTNPGVLTVHASSITADHSAHRRDKKYFGGYSFPIIQFSKNLVPQMGQRFYHLFQNLFPLPNQNTWTFYQLSSKITTKVIFELLTGGSLMGACRRYYHTLGELLEPLARVCPTCGGGSIPGEHVFQTNKSICHRLCGVSLSWSLWTRKVDVRWYSTCSAWCHQYVYRHGYRTLPPITIPTLNGRELSPPIKHILKGFANYDPATANKNLVHPDLVQAAINFAYRKKHVRTRKCDWGSHFHCVLFLLCVG
jgi:ribosomal protein S27AE